MLYMHVYVCIYVNICIVLTCVFIASSFQKPKFRCEPGGRKSETSSSEVDRLSTRDSIPEVNVLTTKR